MNALRGSPGTAKHLPGHTPTTPVHAPTTPAEEHRRHPRTRTDDAPGEVPMTSIFRAAMGPAFDRLHPALRR
ncbi:hypothetical protein ACWCQV_01165, partial [Streptomyces eurythermus]